jgi:hypothetical protein
MVGNLQDQIPEEMEETIQTIKEFLDGKNVRFSVSSPEPDEEGTIWVSFEFEEPVRLTEEQFDEFLDLLEGLGFYHANGGENLIHNFIGYKEWLNREEYRHLDEDVLVYLEYVEVQSSEVVVYLKVLSIATNTIKDENEE